ncbi:MAG TPA: DUF5069 domain-containing protein [Candidatus Acidoferrales bacterium]|nr:DUF5069 domain-containing protein [Candidatus Acidoferrales bacterium]
MAVASGTKVTPLISSGSVGPLGATHLPRLWTKLTLAAAGLLPEGYDECGPGFDAMTISNLGLNKDEVITYVRTRKPTYIEFEEWVVQKGKTDAETIKKHNAAVLGYKHADDKAAHMHQELGSKHHQIKDAVTLNNLEDLNELHHNVTR